MATITKRESAFSWDFLRVLGGSSLAQTVAMMFSFVVSWQLARGLGLDGFGIYALAMSLLALMTVASEYGQGQLLVREVAFAKVRMQWSRIPGLLTAADYTSLTIILGLALVTAVVFTLIDTRYDALRWTFLVGFFLIPTVVLANLRGAVMRGLQHIVWGQVMSLTIRPFLFCILLFIAATIGDISPPRAMGLHLAAASLAALIGAALVRTALKTEVGAHLEVKSEPLLWRQSLPLALSTGMRTAQEHFGPILLGVISTITSVGLFKVAMSLQILVSAPVTILNASTAPLISRLHAENRHRQLIVMLRWIVCLMLAGVLGISIPLMLYGEFLLGVVYAPEYAQAGSALRVLCIAQILNAACGPNASLLTMTGHDKRVTKALGASLALTLTATPALALLWDFTGVAYGTLVATAVWNGMLLRDCRRLLGLDTSILSFLSRIPSATHGLKR